MNLRQGQDDWTRNRTCLTFLSQSTLSVLVKTIQVNCFVLSTSHFICQQLKLKCFLLLAPYSYSWYWTDIATDNGWVHDNLYTMAQSIVLVITAPSLETSCQVYPKVVGLSDVLHLVTLVHHGTWLSQFYLHQVKGVVIPALRGDTSLLSQLHCALREWWSHNPRRSSANIDTAESSEMMLLHSEIQNRTCQHQGGWC